MLRKGNLKAAPEIHRSIDLFGFPQGWSLYDSQDFPKLVLLVVWSHVYIVAPLLTPTCFSTAPTRRTSMPRLFLKRALGNSRLFAAEAVRDQGNWVLPILNHNHHNSPTTRLDLKKKHHKSSKSTSALWREKRAQKCENVRLVD